MTIPYNPTEQSIENDSSEEINDIIKNKRNEEN